MTVNKIIGFGKFTFKELTGKPNLKDINRYETRTGYKHFITNSNRDMELAFRYYAIQSGCMTFESIDQTEYEKHAGALEL